MNDLGEEDYGCTGGGCIPECRFYADQGRIEDEEIRQSITNSWNLSGRKMP